MIKNISFKVIYLVFYILIIISRKFSKSNKSNNKISIFFVKFNNYFVEKRFKNILLKKVSILLPHCIQNYNCPFKITSEIGNCQMCKKCKISDILALKEKYGVGAKIATGGTLARKFIKDSKSELVIAVACERDLISGIYDGFPVPIYGIFNKRVNGPCFNTDVTIEEIIEVLERLK